MPGIRAASLVVLLSAAIVAPQAALPAERWAASEAEAVAVLPQAEAGREGLTARLSCAAQDWTLALSVAPGAPALPAAGQATLAIDGNRQPARSAAAGGGLDIAVPHAALEPLKAGLRLAVELAPESEPLAVFSLRGSRRAITAVEERCTPRVLPGYNRLVFTPYSSYLNLARTLRAEDMRAFRAATNGQPRIAAAMHHAGAERLLFVELCGSSWYYGETGCSIAAFHATDAQAGDPAAWRVVLESEGGALYLDPAPSGSGLPDIVMMAERGPPETQRWHWSGAAYAPDEDHDEMAAD
ncbi:hypothetical protein N1F89_20295 [Aquibium sp. A9E412]|uniref:hypothetical protein n=1 Tax=Aquibium sp. A9E412 TaxID=2976767 RepID=UPI0025B0FFEE|nr:hypothetical protein [Aquibium sp. A9E412]MDN2568571.1 hypothetical protein [Aquibium sp. A9E412]